MLPECHKQAAVKYGIDTVFCTDSKRVAWYTPALPPSMDSEVRAELARILASEPFKNADSARRFLTFVVEEKLSGRMGAIKELVIGREVFARGDDFDPRINPVARVQAGKLRTKLKEYYDGPGWTRR